MSVAKGAVTHTITPVQRTKNEEFWSVRCDSLGVRQNSLMIWRERQINVIHLLCASTPAHIFCMFKNVSVFPRLNVYMYARRTSDQRQYNASRLVEIGAKYWPRVGSLPISIELIDRITQDLDKGKIPISIFLDLSKAFDTLDHSILLQILNHYGIRSVELKLLPIIYQAEPNMLLMIKLLLIYTP